MTDSEKITSSLLYQNDDEKKAARKQCITDTIAANEKYQCYTADQIEQFMDYPASLERSSKEYEAAGTFDQIVRMDERINVFKLACDRFGYKIWHGRAWQNKTCKRNCPLADLCQKETVVIDGERLCRGQIFSKDIKPETLPDSTPILRADGSVNYLKADAPESFGIFFDILFDVSMLNLIKEEDVIEPRKDGKQAEKIIDVILKYKKAYKKGDGTHYTLCFFESQAAAMMKFFAKTIRMINPITENTEGR